MAAAAMPSTAWGRERTPAAAPAPAEEEAALTDGESPPPADAPAQAHWRYARQLFAHEDFVNAAKELELAFARDPRPLYLFNAGQAYRKGEKLVEAKHLYQQFLSLAPDHVLAVDARDHIRTIEQLINQQEQNQQIGFALEQTLKDLEKARKPLPVYKRAWFWLSIAGVASTAVAIGVGVKLYNDQRNSNGGTLSLQF
jgi:tetratricopeptide (TPR) repeat protein